MATFINRTKEITFLKNWLNREPNSLLFVYGPKSSGKTALINHLIEHHLDKNKMAINYMNLRGVLIYNFNSFLDTFFTKNTKGKLREILAGVSINLGFFKVGIEDEALLKQNPFRVMEGQLQKAKSKGIQPILIIDEIQNLKDIYLNGERYLLDELFNLFVRLTKELHVAHVLLLTSDSYFIEDIYEHAKLSRTTTYFYVNHLPKETVMDWLTQEGISIEDADYIFTQLGGCPWEIAESIGAIKDGQSVKQVCERFIKDSYARLFGFLLSLEDTNKKKLMHNIHQDLVNNEYAIILPSTPVVKSLIQEMVERDIWFYHYDEQRITANNQSMWWAIKRSLGAN